jgi:hypothetical protein
MPRRRSKPPQHARKRFMTAIRRDLCDQCVLQTTAMDVWMEGIHHRRKFRESTASLFAFLEAVAVCHMATRVLESDFMHYTPCTMPRERHCGTVVIPVTRNPGRCPLSKATGARNIEVAITQHLVRRTTVLPTQPRPSRGVGDSKCRSQVTK